MIRVRVGEQDAVDEADALPQQLGAQVGGGIDQQVAGRQTGDGRRTRPLIPRMMAGAHRAVASHRRDADRRTGSQQDELTTNIGAERLNGQEAPFTAGWGEWGGRPARVSPETWQIPRTLASGRERA